MVKKGKTNKRRIVHSSASSKRMSASSPSPDESPSTPDESPTPKKSIGDQNLIRSALATTGEGDPSMLAVEKETEKETADTKKNANSTSTSTSTSANLASSSSSSSAKNNSIVLCSKHSANELEVTREGGEQSESDFPAFPMPQQGVRNARRRGASRARARSRNSVSVVPLSTYDQQSGDYTWDSSSFQAPGGRRRSPSPPRRSPTRSLGRTTSSRQKMAPPPHPDFLQRSVIKDRGEQQERKNQKTSALRTRSRSINRASTSPHAHAILRSPPRARGSITKNSNKNNDQTSSSTATSGADTASNRNTNKPPRYIKRLENDDEDAVSGDELQPGANECSGDGPAGVAEGRPSMAQATRPSIAQASTRPSRSRASSVSGRMGLQRDVVQHQRQPSIPRNCNSTVPSSTANDRTASELVVVQTRRPERGEDFELGGQRTGHHHHQVEGVDAARGRGMTPRMQRPATSTVQTQGKHGSSIGLGPITFEHLKNLSISTIKVPVSGRATAGASIMGGVRVNPQNMTGIARRSGVDGLGALDNSATPALSKSQCLDPGTVYSLDDFLDYRPNSALYLKDRRGAAIFSRRLDSAASSLFSRPSLTPSESPREVGGACPIGASPTCAYKNSTAPGTGTSSSTALKRRKIQKIFADGHFWELVEISYESRSCSRPTTSGSSPSPVVILKQAKEQLPASQVLKVLAACNKRHEMEDLRESKKRKLNA
ncbi:unnamed protein product [Amoebophrya sp. A25]|nr:unnamed protein product [Amoebophrya sp. A25]|eukprot:GSA25T00025353001.1